MYSDARPGRAAPTWPDRHADRRADRRADGQPDLRAVADVRVGELGVDRRWAVEDAPRVVSVRVTDAQALRLVETRLCGDSTP